MSLFLSPLVSFFPSHVTSKSLNNIDSYNGMYLPKFIQKKIPWSTPISQIEQCTTTLILEAQVSLYRSRWSTSKIVFSDPDLGSKWPPSADIVLT
jgi:hypothetical protein